MVRLSLLWLVALACSLGGTAWGEEEHENPPGLTDFLSELHSKAPAAPPPDSEKKDCVEARPVTETVGVQRMYPAQPEPPPGSVFEPYTRLPTAVHRLTLQNFTFDSALARLLPSGLGVHTPWIVDFYGQANRLSAEDEAALFSAATVLDGVCALAVCDLGEIVQQSKRSRALPAYPCLAGYSNATNFFGRMIGSKWKGNRSLGGIVDSCLSLVAEAQAALVARRLDALTQSQPSDSSAATEETPTPTQSRSDEAVTSKMKKNHEQPKSTKKKTTTTKKKAGQIEAVCSACMAVADELSFALGVATSKFKRLREADVVELLEPICKTAVRGKYILQESAEGGQWVLSGTVLKLGYSHAATEKKLQSERIWRYCDSLLERAEEPLTASLVAEGALEQLVHNPAGMRALLCSVLTQECEEGQLRQHTQGANIADASRPARSAAVSPEAEKKQGSEDQTKKHKKRPKKGNKSKMEDFVITDEDISTIQEVSPGVFVDNFEPDKIASYLRGEPDELDLLVCKLEELQRRTQRDRELLEQQGEEACDGPCSSRIAAAVADIEKLKDTPVDTWSASGEHTAGQDHRVTYRALEAAGRRVPKCGQRSVAAPGGSEGRSNGQA